MTHPLDLVLRRVRGAVRLVLTACPLLAAAGTGLWRPALLYTVGGLILAIRPPFSWGEAAARLRRDDPAR